MNGIRVVMAVLALVSAAASPSSVRATGAVDLAWVWWATNNQRNEIAIDEPINWVMRVMAHNAMASQAYGQDIDPNQSLSVSTVLNRGARALELDVHVLDGQLFLCHNDICAEARVSYDALLEEIGAWLDQNPDEFVWIRLEYRPHEDSCKVLPADQCNDASMDFEEVAEALGASVVEHLDRGVGRVWRPSEALFVGQNGLGKDQYIHPAPLPDYCSTAGTRCFEDADCPFPETCESAVPAGDVHIQRWPTLRELRTHGKGVMITSMGMRGCCGEDCGPYAQGDSRCSSHSMNAGASCSDWWDCQGLLLAVPWMWEDGGSGGVVSVGTHRGGAKGFDFEACTDDGTHYWDPDGETGGGYPEFSAVVEDRTESGWFGNTEGILTAANVADLARCNVARISMDFLDAAQRTSSIVCLGWLGELCPGDDLRMANTVWSWKYGWTPEGNEDYAFMAGVDGRWAAAIPQNNFRCACGVPRDGEPDHWTDERGEVWRVTRDTGFWDECPAICEAEFGLIGLAFSVPVNGFQNERLYDALKTVSAADGTDLDLEQVWLRFRETPIGWTKLSAPKIQNVSVVENAVDPDQRDVVVTIDNPDGRDVTILYEYSDGSSSDVDIPVMSGGSQAYIDTRSFIEEGDYSVEVSALSPHEAGGGGLFLQDTATRTFNVEFANNLPVISLPFVNLTQDDLEELPVGYRLLETGSFYDPDDDDWIVVVHYGDADDSRCIDGTCSGAPFGACDTDLDCGTVVRESALGGGWYRFEMTNLYTDLGEYQVTIAVDDGEGIATATFTVFNFTPSEEPVIQLGASGCATDRLSEGEQLDCSLVFRDANSDQDSFEAQVNFGDGAGWETITDIRSNTIGDRLHLFFFSHVYSTAGVYPIRVRVTDDGGNADPVYVEERRCIGGADVCEQDSVCPSGTCGGLFEVSVFGPNTPPTVCPVDIADCGGVTNTGGDITIQQGDTVSRSFRIVDPDAGDQHEVYVRYAPGLDARRVSLDANLQFTLEHTYNAQGAFELAFSVTSRFNGADVTQNGTGRLFFLVTVLGTNTEPELDAVADETALEGDLFATTIGYADPDNDVWTAFVEYGAGSGFIPATVDTPNKTVALNHVFDDNGVYQVTVILADGRDTVLTVFDVVVENVPPTALFAALRIALVGGSPTLSVLHPSDAAADTAAGFTYAFDCGDGTGFGAFGSDSSTSCPVETAEARTVGARIRDKDGAESQYTRTIRFAQPAAGMDSD